MSLEIAIRCNVCNLRETNEEGQKKWFTLDRRSRHVIAPEHIVPAKAILVHVCPTCVETIRKPQSFDNRRDVHRCVHCGEYTWNRFATTENEGRPLGHHEGGKGWAKDAIQATNLHYCPVSLQDEEAKFCREHPVCEQQSSDSPAVNS